MKTRYDPYNAFKFPQSTPSLNKWGSKSLDSTKTFVI
ncbi:hypothetical protein [Peribacillus frigoritolerans]